MCLSQHLGFLSGGVISFSDITIVMSSAMKPSPHRYLHHAFGLPEL
jgi:hypothetical protein